MNLCMLLTVAFKESATVAEVQETIRAISKQYKPPAATKYALKVPIDFFNRNEKAIRRWMKAEGYRLFYRGPRCQTTYNRKCKLYGKTLKFAGQPLTGVPSMTRRENATHVVFARTL